MATTDINGMVFYANTDQVTSLNANLNAISTAVTNAFNSETRTFRVANQAARDALLALRGASASSPLRVDRADTGNSERNISGLSTGWVVVETNAAPTTGVFHPLTFETGWSAYEGFGPPGWTRDESGVITWQGLIKRSGVTFSAGSTGAIANVPDEARPTGGTLFDISASTMGTLGFVRVNVGATITAQSVTGAAVSWTQNEYINLTGIAYRR